jgi:hypothetical protein
MKVTRSSGWAAARALGIAGVVLLWSSLVGAAPVAQRWHPAHVWHGDIARFHEHDWAVWHGGHWVNARHGGRLGWWWVAGGTWYLYPAPVYPYPSPWEPAPVVIANPSAGVVPPVPATQYWYYCEASRAYYPYVPRCPGGWKQVPATPADAPAAASK